ncbi:hypothetical protein CL621_01940 [archaeon]|nr:hypothetical protein [archaeon]
MKKKTDWRLIIGIIGWTLIILIWLWMSLRYFRRNDLMGGILNIIVAVFWTIFGIINIRKYLSKKLKK